MPKHERVALFMDYENFYTSLHKRFEVEAGCSRPFPSIDFTQLVDFISDNYGLLDRRDFLAVANFTHYDGQKGGLNRVATLLHVDSFEIRQERNESQSSPGKKYVMKDYADMRLALEIGHHLAIRPASLYLIASGDKAFAAVGRAILQHGRSLIFILPFPELAALIIKQEFKWIDFLDTQVQQAEIESAESEPPAKPATTQDAVTDLCHLISTLRQEFLTPVPLVLIKAFYGTEAGQKLVQAGLSQGLIDIWDDPNGITCVSLRQERMFGKVVPMAVRTDFAARANRLYLITQLAEGSLSEPNRAGWRRALKEQGPMSVKEAKQLLDTLLDLGILRDGRLERPLLNQENMIRFLAESRL